MNIHDEVDAVVEARDRLHDHMGDAGPYLTHGVLTIHQQVTIPLTDSTALVFPHWPPSLPPKRLAWWRRLGLKLLGGTQ